MNKIDTTQILDPNVQQPFTGPSLKFLQDAMGSIGLASVLGFAYGPVSPISPIILSGCVDNGTAISDGFVFSGTFNGSEIFQVVGATYSGFSNPPILRIITTADVVADPLTFSDGTNKNVHNVRRMVVTDALPTLGGDTLYSSFVKKDNPIGSLTPTSGAWATNINYVKKDHVVHLRGTLTLTANDTDTINLPNLPASCRPATAINVGITGLDDNVGIIDGILSVSTGGAMTVSFNWTSTFPYSASGRKIYFDGLNWLVAPGW